MDSRRAEALSDGVFAVAITVLVFNLLPIAGEPGRLTASGLAGFWPAYAAYAVSFMTIGIMWLNHHTLLDQLTRVDRPLLVLNLFLLMGVVAIPFPTALVADHLTGARGGHGQAAVAVVTYGLVMIAISVGYGAIWLYLTGHAEALGARRAIAGSRASTVRFTGGNAGYAAGTLIAAFVSPVAALAIFGLLAVYYLFEHLPSPPGDDDPARADDPVDAGGRAGGG